MSWKFQIWCKIGKGRDRTGITSECVESDKPELNRFSEAFGSNNKQERNVGCLEEELI